MKNLMCFLFLLLFCFSLDLKANSPVIIPNFPQSGQENIAVNSKISFYTNYEIDTSSLIHLSPIQNFYVNDTVFVEKKYAQIMLIRKEYYQNVPDSLHYIYATEGSITTNTDNITINFNIHSLLDYETEYTLVVKDLFVIKPDTTQPSGYDTLAIDTTIVDFFKTTEVPIQLVSTSIDDREYQVLAGENLELLFSKKFLSSDLTNHNIATLAKVIDTVYVDSVNYYYVLDTVSTQRTLALDSTKIILNPDSLLELGKSYILSVDLKNIYGEYQPFYKEFWVKNYAKITLVTRAYYYDPDTNVVTDLFGSVYYEPDFDNAPLRDTVDNSFMGIVESQDVIYYPGTEFLARVPVTTPNDFYFVGFECPEDSSLNANYEDNTISVALTDTNLIDRTIIAKYKLAEDLQIELPFNVNIRGYDNVVCTKDSTIVYSFKNMPNNEVTIYPQCTTGIPLLNWTSNDPEYDGSAVPCISVPSSPKIDFGPFHYPHKRDFIPNWDNMYTPCTGSRYKVELRYASNFVSDYETKQYEIPLSGINTNDIISTFQVITTLDPLVYETVNINTLESSIYCGISQEYTDPTHNQKIIKFEINSQYKDIYEILYVQCYSNGILDGSKPNGSDIYLSNGEDPIGDSWEHNIENKNLKLYLGQFGGSSNCLETIYVYICRKMQKLTIEREMTDSSHVPTNLITFLLRNSDDTAPIEYLEYKIPKKVTVYYLDGRGKEIRNFKTFYAIPSGVDIRIVPECKANSGYSLDEWKCDVGYTCTTVLPTYEKPGENPQSRELVLSTTMNQDRKVCMLSDAGFRLNYIGFNKYYKNSDDQMVLGQFYFAAYPPNDIPGNEQVLNIDESKPYTLLPSTDIYEQKFSLGLTWDGLINNDEQYPNEFQKRACKLFLIFNKAPDKESLEQNFWCEDYKKDLRKDGKKNQEYRMKFMPEENENLGVNCNATTIRDNEVVYLLIKISDNPEEKNIWAPHMQKIQFFMNNQIKTDIAKTGELLYLENGSDNNEVVKPTVLPGIRVYASSFYNGFEDLEFYYDAPIEAYIYSTATLLPENGGKQITITDPGFTREKDGTYKFGVSCKQIPALGDHEMARGTYWYLQPEEEIFRANQLNESNKLSLYFQLMDHDDAWLKELPGLAVKAAGILIKNGFTWKALGEIAVEVAAKATDGNDDEWIGYTGIQLINHKYIYINYPDGGGTVGNYIIEKNEGHWGLTNIYEPVFLESNYYYTTFWTYSTNSTCWDGYARFKAKIKIELGDFWLE